MEESRWGKKFRALTLALIFSGSLNIALLGTLIFRSFEEKEKPLFVQKKEAGNLEQLARMSQQTFRELVACLTNREEVEDGYLKRDLALAALIAFADFNLEKALSEPLPQGHAVFLSPDQKVEIFPGLTDEQFQRIIQFAYEGEAPPVVVAPPPAYRFHVVKEGETLWKIARQYRMPLDELVRLNDLERDQIFPGMTLRVPL